MYLEAAWITYHAFIVYRAIAYLHPVLSIVLCLCGIGLMIALLPLTLAWYGNTYANDFARDSDTRLSAWLTYGIWLVITYFAPILMVDAIAFLFLN